MGFRHPRHEFFLLLTLCLSLLLSCSYSFKGSLPPHLKTVDIPAMENRTPEYGVAEDLDRRLYERMLQDGLLRIASAEQASSRLSLVLLEVREVEQDIDEEQSTTRVRLTLKVKAEFFDLIEDRSLWVKTISEWGDYSPTGSPDRDEALDTAVDKLVESINQQMLADW
jgi:hypothetical protein